MEKSWILMGLVLFLMPFISSTVEIGEVPANYKGVVIAKDVTGIGGSNLSWNQSHANTLYADISVTGDNSSWNQSHASNLYWTLDGASAPPTSNWNMGNYGFTNLGNSTFIGKNYSFNYQGETNFYANGTKYFSFDINGDTLKIAQTVTMPSTKKIYIGNLKLDNNELWVSSGDIKIGTSDPTDGRLNLNNILYVDNNLDEIDATNYPIKNIGSVNTDFDSSGNLNMVGTNITANYYFGNGSQLTGISITESDPFWSSNFTNMQSECPRGNYTYGIYGNGTFKCRSDKQGSGGGNPFDQSLNTTDSPTFTNLDIDTLLNVTEDIISETIALGDYGAVSSDGSCFVLDDTHPTVKQYANRETGGVAVDLNQVYFKKTSTGATSRVGSFGIFGAIPSTTYLMYMEPSSSTSPWSGSLLKVDNRRCIGIGLSGYNRCTAGNTLTVQGNTTISEWIQIGDTNTGSNAGSDICIDANNRLCACGSCA